MLACVASAKWVSDASRQLVIAYHKLACRLDRLHGFQWQNIYTSFACLQYCIMVKAGRCQEHMNGCVEIMLR